MTYSFVLVLKGKPWITNDTLSRVKGDNDVVTLTQHPAPVRLRFRRSAPTLQEAINACVLDCERAGLKVEACSLGVG